MLVAHLSDLHLGRKSPGRGDPQGAERLTSFRQALTNLADRSPAAFLIAGDVFDSAQIDRAVVQETARMLDKIKDAQGKHIPVAVIPGNHDPSEAIGLWKTFQTALRTDSSVTLALVPQTIEIAGGSLLVEAYPCETRYSAEAPWVKRLDTSRLNGNPLRVVLAHGTLEGGPVPEGEADAYPFSRFEVESLGADYVALGHFHGIYPAWNGDGEIQRSFCYSGTHEPDQFVGDAGNAILATLEKGHPPRLNRIQVGRRHWRALEIRGPLDLHQVEKLRDDLESDDPTRFVIRVRCSSAKLLDEESTKLEGLIRSMCALGAQIERQGEAQPFVDVETLNLALLPSGAIKETLISLRSDLDREKDLYQREIISAALQLGWQKMLDAEAIQ